MQKNLVQAETISVCDICETMVKEVTNLLENNRTEVWFWSKGQLLYCDVLK